MSLVIPRARPLVQRLAKPLTRPTGAVVAAPKVVYGPLAFNDVSTDWGGLTFIVLVAAADLAAADGDKIRIHTRMAAWSIGGMMKGFARQAAAAGDAYDFLGTPAPLLCGEQETVTSTGSNLDLAWTATLPETFDKTKPHLFAFSFSSVPVVTLRRIGSAVTSGSNYYKSGDDAATPNKSGYSAWDAGYPHLVSQIEVGAF